MQKIYMATLKMFLIICFIKTANAIVFSFQLRNTIETTAESNKINRTAISYKDKATLEKETGRFKILRPAGQAV